MGEQQRRMLRGARLSGGLRPAMQGMVFRWEWCIFTSKNILHWEDDNFVHMEQPGARITILAIFPQDISGPRTIFYPGKACNRPFMHISMDSVDRDEQGFWPKQRMLVKTLFFYKFRI